VELPLLPGPVRDRVTQGLGVALLGLPWPHPHSPWPAKEVEGLAPDRCYYPRVQTSVANFSQLGMGEVNLFDAP
jgi:hypothetical protein